MGQARTFNGFLAEPNAESQVLLHRRTFWSTELFCFDVLFMPDRWPVMVGAKPRLFPDITLNMRDNVRDWRAHRHHYAAVWRMINI